MKYKIIAVKSLVCLAERNIRSRRREVDEGRAVTPKTGVHFRSRECRGKLGSGVPLFVVFLEGVEGKPTSGN